MNHNTKLFLGLILLQFSLLALFTVYSKAETLQQDIQNVVKQAKEQNKHILLPQNEAMDFMKRQFTTHIETLHRLHPNDTRPNIKKAYLKEIRKRYPSTTTPIGLSHSTTTQLNLTIMTPTIYKGSSFTFEELMTLKLYSLANAPHSPDYSTVVELLVKDMQKIYHGYSKQTVRDTVYLVIENLKKRLERLSS